MTAAVVLGATPAYAQAGAEGFSLGIGGGFSRGPSSPYGSSTIGYHLLGTLEFPSPTRFLRLRTDGLFADWGAGRVTSLTGNVLFTPISGKRVAPYVLAGAGGYASQGSGIKPGWTLGAGLRLPGELRTIILESRMHVFRAHERPFPGVMGTDNNWRYVFTPIGFAIQF
jgi:hypothetical protein